MLTSLTFYFIIGAVYAVIEHFRGYKLGQKLPCLDMVLVIFVFINWPWLFLGDILVIINRL